MEEKMKRTGLKTVQLLATCLLLSSLNVFSAAAAQEPVTLRFVSLAWQEQAIASVKEIVAAWNEANPDVQVEYQQVDWGSINDYLTTAFETGSVPDIFHNESTQILDFGRRGYLTDLAPLISDDMQSDIVEGAWATVDDGDDKIWGVPFLWESRIVLYNKDLFEAAGIDAPTVENPWSWNDMREAAKTPHEGKPLIILAQSNPFQAMPILEERFPRLHYVRFKSEDERARMNISIAESLGIYPIDYAH